MKKVTYVIEQELHYNGDWFGTHTETSFYEAKKTYKSYLRNCKDNPVMANMKARIRMRKVTEEFLCEENLF
jgi:hypothetical protein